MRGLDVVHLKGLGLIGIIKLLVWLGLLLGDKQLRVHKSGKNTTHERAD